MAKSVKEIILIYDPSITDNDLLDDRIEIETSLTDESFFGDYYNYAIAYKILHEYEMSSRAGSTGPVINKKVGEVSEGYGFNSTASGQTGYYTSTTWGQRYLQLIKSIGVPFGNAIAGFR